MHVQIDSAFQESGTRVILRQPPRTGLRLAMQPATAASPAATANAAIGMAKLPVACVTLPTPHIARAPASEPEPLKT
jgi:hypothetical protein